MEPSAEAPWGAHIRIGGEEARRGDVLIPTGTLVTPPVIGLAAATGNDTLVVIPHADVDVFVLGDELLDSGLAGTAAPGMRWGRSCRAGSALSGHPPDPSGDCPMTSTCSRQRLSPATRGWS